MLTITGYEVELIKDPFKILTGERYEFLLDMEVPEDDELFSEDGIYIRALYVVEEDRAGLIKYELYEQNTNRYIDFELEQDEIEAVETFCKNHRTEAK